MTDTIEPALTAVEWSKYRAGNGPPGDYVALINPRRLIALANDTLPKSDPRKITRDHLAVLRLLRGKVNEHEMASWGNLLLLDGLIAALESYLPPAEL